jgi:Tfp pilus assembly protein PilF
VWSTARASIYFKVKDATSALADCTQALANDPNCAEAYGVRGLVYARQKRVAEARLAYEKAGELGHGLFWLEEAEIAP